MLELLVDQPIFIGFKVSSNLKRQLESLSGPDKKYISTEDSTYLRMCRTAHFGIKSAPKIAPRERV